MSFDLAVSLLLAVPLAVLGNLASIPVQRGFAKWLDLRTSRDKMKLRKRIELAEHTKAHPNATTAAIAIDGVAAVIFAVFGAVMVIMSATHPALNHDGLFPWSGVEDGRSAIYLTVTQLMALLALVTALGAFRSLLKKARQLRDVDHLADLKEALARLDGPK